MEEERVPWSQVPDKHLHLVNHVGSSWPPLRIGLVVCEQHDVVVLEAKPGLQQVTHAQGIIDAAIQGKPGAPAMNKPCWYLLKHAP